MDNENHARSFNQEHYSGDAAPTQGAGRIQPPQYDEGSSFHPGRILNRKVGTP